MAEVPSIASVVDEIARLKRMIDLEAPDASECPECVGRGWQGGIRHEREADGDRAIDCQAYKIKCPNCDGTGQSRKLG